MATPKGKMNLIHQLILGGLTAPGQSSRSHKVWDADANDVVTTTVPIVAAPVGLAANVSTQSLEALARRWAV